MRGSQSLQKDSQSLQNPARLKFNEDLVVLKDKPQRVSRSLWLAFLFARKGF
jgi:hypothetical protein